MQRQCLTFMAALVLAAFAVGVTAAPIQGPDTTTQGNWIDFGTGEHVYGSQGYILPGFVSAGYPGSNANDLASLPAAINDYQVKFQNAAVPSGCGRGAWWGGTTHATLPYERALLHPTPPVADYRKANYVFDNSGFDVTMRLNQLARYNMSLYFMSWDSHTRSSTITVPGKTPVVTGDIYDGKWYTTDVSGDPANPVQFSVTQAGSGSNVVLTGITFDQATDNSTQGSWVGVYGSDGYILPGFKGASPTPPGDQSYDRFSLPPYIADYSISLNDGKRYQWAYNPATNDPRSVQDPDFPSDWSKRKASIVYDSTEIGLHLEANVPTYFDLSLYVVDWDDGGRAGSIQIPAAGINDAVSNYQDGRWYLYRVYAGPGDPLDITFTPSISNAVVSAICFDKGYMFPEPTTLALLAGGLLAAAVRRRRRT